MWQESCQVTLTGACPAFGSGKLNSPASICSADDLAVVLDLDVVGDAELLAPLRVGLAPHHVAGRAGGRSTVSAPASFTACDVLLHRLDEEVPLAGDEHRRRAAVLLLAEVGEVDAGRVQQPDGGLADVVLDVGGRAAGEVDVLRLVLGPVLLPEVLREPVRPVLPVAGPDVALGARAPRPSSRRSGSSSPSLRGSSCRASSSSSARSAGRSAAVDVAQLAGRADQEVVDPAPGPTSRGPPAPAAGSTTCRAGSATPSRARRTGRSRRRSTPHCAQA